MLAMLMFAGVVYGQQVTVTGNVTSLEDGLPIPGVTVLEKGTTNGTTTGPDGNYTIRVASDATLVFSFLGMEPQELDLAGRTRIDVVMTMSVVEMDEVVVTSLGISREKKSLGYAMTEVGSDDISLVKDHNPANSLVGKVAGVVVTQGTGGPGSASRIIIRGNNSITGNNQPLIVVDGIPILDEGVNSGGSVYRSTVTPGGMTYVNPDDIESISVLKGPNAAALYGSRAGNGVLLITTKKGTRNRGLGVTVNSNITFDTPMVLPDYQNEYGQGSQGSVPTNLVDLKNSAGSWGARLDGSQKLYYTGEQRPYVAQPDNVRDFFRTAGKYINTISLDGGGETYSARFSYTNNMTEMGNLKKYLPITHITFLIAALAISGIPPFSGFFSKDEILVAAMAKNPFHFWIEFIVAGLTAFYMFRLYFVVFWGEKRVYKHTPHESPLSMTIPLLILALASAFSGLIPFSQFISSDAVPFSIHMHWNIAIPSIIISLIGISIAAWLYRKPSKVPDQIVAGTPMIHRSLMNKLYIDEIYLWVTHTIIFNGFAKAANWFDHHIIDGTLNGLASITNTVSDQIKELQSGQLQKYGMYMISGVLALFLLFIYLIS